MRRPVVSLLDIRRRLDVIQAALGVAAPLEDVRAYTLNANWSDNDEGAGWWVDSQGHIHCRGVLYCAGGANHNNPVVFPIGFRPLTVNVWGTVIGQNSATNAMASWAFIIGANGQMFIQPNPAVAGGPVPTGWVIYMYSIAPFRIDQ